jgi:hypothetical protein
VTAGPGPHRQNRPETISGHLDGDQNENTIDPAQDRGATSLLGGNGKGHDVSTEILDRHLAVMRGHRSLSSLDLTQSNSGTD